MLWAIPVSAVLFPWTVVALYYMVSKVLPVAEVTANPSSTPTLSSAGHRGVAQHFTLAASGFPLGSAGDSLSIVL